MVEKVDLSTPDQVEPGTNTYRVSRVDLNFDGEYIGIWLVGDNGEVKEISYNENNGALALMITLNKVDLSAKSLHKRLLEKLIADGHLAGTVSGIPD